ncbi:MAG TPA: hypothetical protein VNU26_08795 [Mycobacteriales bacterium]|nr:hypothetical protein [Mycobacteriales bacterium]
MRRRPALAAALVALPLIATAGTADSGWSPTAGGWVSGDVEYVGTVPLETAFVGSSATLHDEHLYVTTFRSFSVYDVSDPLEPRHLSTEHLGVQLYNEQPDTDGRILLLTSDSASTDVGVAPPRLALRGELQVWDVQDKSDPVLASRLPLERREHMWTCVLDCRYAYGAAGAIVDLADPTRPELVGDWSTLVDPKPTARDIHAVEEVAPGLVLTGGSRVHLLDARQDATAPEVLASVSPPLTKPGPPSNPTSLPAHLEWPAGGQRPFALISMETPLGGDCDSTTGGFQTYDTSDWQETGTFRFVDEYVLAGGASGTYTDGRSPHHVFGCSAYGFDVAPHYASRGTVAVAWFEDGVRLLEVGADGRIVERGGFVPLGGSTTLPIWRTSKIVYAIDMYRGIDILRVGGGRP